MEEDLERLVREASFDEVARAAQGWDDKRKKAAAKWSTEFWKNRGTRLGQAHEQGETRMRLAILHAAVAKDAKAALLIAPPFHNYGVPWDQYWLPQPVDAQAKLALLNVVAARGREFAVEYVNELTEAKRKRAHYLDIPVALIEAFGLPLPQDPFLVRAWAVQLGSLHPYDENAAKQAYLRTVFTVRSRVGENGLPVFEGADVTPATPAEGAAQLPGLRFMPQAVLAVRDAASDFGARYQPAFLMDGVQQMFRTLAAQGAVDRAALTAAAIAALVRADAVAAQRMQARLLDAAEPDAAILAPHADALASLLATANITPADVAQRLLARLDAAQPLDGALFVSICQMVFARKEKGLRQAQLAWAARRAREQAAQRVASALGICEALACADFSLQSDAVAKLLPVWDSMTAQEREQVRPALDAGSAELDAKLKSRLMAHVGGAGEAPAPPAPAAVERRPLAAAPVRAPWPVREPLLPLRDLQADPTRMVDALQNTGYDSTLEAVEQLQELGIRAARMEGTRLPDQIAAHLGAGGPSSWTNPIPTLAKLRALEIRLALSGRKPYPLLSMPSFRDGTIAADDLVRRLDEALASALPFDLLFALLRVDGVGQQHIDAMRRIDTPDATAAADFLAAGGLAQMQTRWEITERKERPTDYRSPWRCVEGREVFVAVSAMASLPAVGDVPLGWASGFQVDNAPDIYEFDLRPDLVTGVLPANAELLAAFHLWGFRKAGLEWNTEGGKACCLALPLFTAASGPAGPALHLAVFYAMSANAPEARIAGSDGLLALLAQGRFDGALACELLAACIGCGSVKATRIAAALESVADAGEEREVWPLLAAAVGAALRLEAPPPGTADLLALASRLAPALGIKGGIEPLAAVAARKGTSKLLVEARRLQEALTA